MRLSAPPRLLRLGATAPPPLPPPLSYATDDDDLQRMESGIKHDDSAHLDLHYVPRSCDAIRLGVGDVARQRRPVVLISYLILQCRLHLSQYLSAARTHAIAGFLFASADDVVFSSALVCAFVRWRYCAKNHHSIDFTKFGRKTAHGPRKKSLDFGGNPDRVTLGLGLK